MSFDYQTICAALYREARLLDDRQWMRGSTATPKMSRTGCLPGMTTTS